MENKSMRFLSLLLALVMVIGLMPVGHAHAEEGAVLVPGEMVTEVEANETYLIALHGTQKYLTNQAGSSAWGTHTLSMADSSVAEAKNMWMLVPEGDGYKLQNELGFLVLGSNSLDFSETGDVFSLDYHGEDGWTIGTVCGDGTMRYFNHLGGTAYGYTIGGWTGDGTKFDIYEIAEKSMSEVDPWGKRNWVKVSVDTETIWDAKEGNFEYAWDSNPGTIWHSDWKTATDKLNGENTFTGVIDFGQAYTINQFSFTPRQDGNASGLITQASLYVKATEEAEWTLVGENATFEANFEKKDFNFEEQAVRFVKFVAEQSNDGWVAVAEFDIDYNAPAHEHSYEAVVTEGKKCTVCGEPLVQQEEIPALGHNEEVISGKDATCTESGLTEGKKCTACGEILARQEEIPALGHNYENGSCVNCGEADPDYVEVIAKGWSGYTTWVLTSDGVLTFTPSEQTENGQTNLKNYWKVDGVLTLPWSEYAELITEVVISDGIHDIGQMAFYQLPNLQSVTLGKDIVEIRNYAFKNCKSLTTINLENVDFIREGAFYGCSALENITFMDGVVVEDWAFSKTPYASMNP